MPEPKPHPLDPPAEADDPEQSRRFLDIAREVGADESPGALDRALDKIIPPSRVQDSALSKGRQPGSNPHPKDRGR